MKNLSILTITIFCIIFTNTAFANSINPAVYKTMTGTSYRNNYRLNTRQISEPYWKMQSNPATRNNNSFINNQTQNFNQNMGQYRYNMKLMRGY